MQRTGALLVLLIAAACPLGLGCSDSNDGGLPTGGTGGTADGTGGTGGTGDTGDLDTAGEADGSGPDAEATGGSGGGATGGTGVDNDAGPDTASGDLAPASMYCMTAAVGTGAPALLDDFEDGNPVLPANDGRIGEWSFSKNTTAVTMPATSGPLTPVAGGTAGATSKAVHISGTDPMGWGGEITATIVAAEGTGCYDASAYTGIKFSIKGRAGGKVFVYARGATIRAMEATAGHYRKELTLTADWQEVTLKWADFAPSWGTPPEPKLVNPRELYAIAVQTSPGANPSVGEFDVWLDTVELTH